MLARTSKLQVRTLAPLARSYMGESSPTNHFDRADRPARPSFRNNNRFGGSGDRFSGSGDRFGGDRRGGFKDDQRVSRTSTLEKARNNNIFNATKRDTTPPNHLLTLADFSVDEISKLVRNALAVKLTSKVFGPTSVRRSLNERSVAMIFSKRSTRTRVATETSVAGLGGHPFFLGKDDIQLGVNETLKDSAKVISSMTDGIMARVAKHEEVATLAEHSTVPVVNALCDLYHPTQILADLLTMVETYAPVEITGDQFDVQDGPPHRSVREFINDMVNVNSILEGKKVAWVGDQNNITNELMVTLPRFGMELSIAAPKGYDTVDPRVLQRIEEHGTADKITYTNDPAVACKDADLVVTDTWISMGQEEETAKRLAAFEGYQITNEMVDGAGAKPDWKFMHCLPRHKEEVDDAVFYGERSLVFPEAENRKWTIMAVLDALVGRWDRS